VPKIIQTGEFIESLRRRFRLVGRTKFGLDETVVATIGVGDLRAALWLPFWGGATRGGVAAQSTSHTLENPPNSSKLLLLDYALVQATTSWQVRVLVTAAQIALMTNIPALPRDETSIGGVGRTYTLSQAAAIGSPSPIQQFNATVGAFDRLDFGSLANPYILFPGRAIGVGMNNVNFQSNVAWFWREVDIAVYATNAGLIGV